MYWELVDREFTWENMSIEEQSRLVACGRSNHRLCSAKLEAVARDPPGHPRGAAKPRRAKVTRTS